MIKPRGPQMNSIQEEQTTRPKLRVVAELRTVREQLRYEIFQCLNEIEDIVAIALDHIADEAVTFGAAPDHDFNIDRQAAQAVDEIRYELDRMTEKMLRLIPVEGAAT
jgi:hypothetical protein